MLPFELFPFGKQISSANQHGTEQETNYGKVESSRHTDVRCWILNVLNWKDDRNKQQNCEVKF